VIENRSGVLSGLGREITLLVRSHVSVSVDVV
jgi:hypothetical protein